MWVGRQGFAIADNERLIHGGQSRPQLPLTNICLEGLQLNDSTISNESPSCAVFNRILGKVFVTCAPFRDARAKVPEKLGAFCSAEVVATNSGQPIAQPFSSLPPLCFTAKLPQVTTFAMSRNRTSSPLSAFPLDSFSTIAALVGGMLPGEKSQTIPTLYQCGLNVFPVSSSVFRRERIRGHPSAQAA